MHVIADGGGYKSIDFNGSGYYDETAYKAIIRVKEDRKMNDAMGGDIWTVQKPDGSMREILILARHGNYVTMLQLTDNEPPYNSVTVYSRCEMYADAGRISFAYVDNLVELIKSLNTDAYAEIMGAVIGALTVDMPEGSATAQVLPEAVPEKDQLSPASQGGYIETISGDARIMTLGSPDSPYGKLKTAYHDLEITQAETAKERDIYKELFFKAFPQMGGV